VAKEKLWINPRLYNIFIILRKYAILLFMVFFALIPTFIFCINDLYIVKKHEIFFFNASKFIIFVKLLITKLLINCPKLWYLKLLQQLHKTKQDFLILFKCSYIIFQFWTTTLYTLGDFHFFPLTSYMGMNGTIHFQLTYAFSKLHY